MLFRHINFKLFVGLIISGIIGMWTFQNIRSNTEINVGELSHPVVLISDLTIPARTTYCALEYVDKNGYTYGKSMSLGLLGTVPFMASFTTGGNNEQFESASLLTKYTYKIHNIATERIIGLGITVIGDIYLSFGLIGVILFMYFTGFIINKYTLLSLSMNYYAIIVMAGFLANSVYIVRSCYTYPVRYILWPLIIAVINRYIITGIHEKTKENSNIYTQS
jgi:hypothetical protein